MRKLIILLFVSALWIPISLNAQNHPEGPHGQRDMKKWVTEMTEFKHQYLTRKLCLTAEQQREFFPLYDKMSGELWKIGSETRRLERNIQKSPENERTDLEYDMATQASIELKGKECEIEKTYYEKFKSILSKKQLFELRKAERDFTMKMMNRHHQIRDKKQ